MYKKIITLKYKCNVCGRPEVIGVRDCPSEKLYQVMSKCFDNKICLDCYFISEKTVDDTAENIVALMC